MSVRHFNVLSFLVVMGIGSFYSAGTFASVPVWVDSSSQATNELMNTSTELTEGMEGAQEPDLSITQPQLFTIDTITPGAIINLGKMLWPIIVAGRPVVDIRTDWANAVPQGVNNWESMGGWKAPISKSFSFKWKNLGVRMINFQYSVVFTPGGSTNGKGRYLANVSVIPAKVNVSWGYKFSSQAQVSGITNVGSESDPVAALQLVLTWTIETPVTHHQLSSDFYMTGAGDFREVTTKIMQ